MAKDKTSLAQTQQRLSDHKFDTSDYIVLDTGVRRESSTGRLVSTKVSAESHKSKK
jgi:hypothetical protein